MNYRAPLAVLLVIATGFVIRSRVSAAESIGSSPAAGTRTASVANERSFPAGSERSFRSFGVFSGPEENEVGDTEPDRVFTVPRRRFGPTPPGATASGATAGGGAPTDATTQSGGRGGSRGSIPLRDHPQVQEIIADVLEFFRNREVSVSLLHGHKYMINDCLGIKVSAGEFRIRFADPRLGFVSDKLVFECGLEHVSFSQFKIKMRPRVPSFSDPNPCHFTKKFELGGSADDVRLKVSFDPVVNNDTCRVALGKIDITVRIGSLDLKPLQNNLDDMAKNMVEDALSVFLDMAFVPDMFDRIEYLIQVGCGGTGGSGGSAGGSSGGGNNSDLERRVADLEARVAALEQQSSTGSSATSVSSDAGAAARARTDGTSAGAGSAGGTKDAGGTTAADGAARSGGATSTTRTPGASLPGATARPGTGGNAAFTIVPNPELKGRLGRIVVTFPTGTKDLQSRIETFKAGDSKILRTDYGDVVFEIPTSTYDLKIGGRAVTGVTVESRSDTRVHVGVLRLNATGETRFEVFEPGQKKVLGTYYGQTDVGLPVGSFEVEVNGQRETVTVIAGAIADY